MADDWIKWVKGLENKPEVISISIELSIDRDSVAGKLMRLWAWCDEHIAENNVDASGWATLRMASTPEANCAALDGTVGMKGFADAMRHAGWLATRGATIAFPNYSRHSGPTAKSRARNSRNQKMKRERDAVTESANGDRTVTERRPEKREREREIKPPPPPPNKPRTFVPDSGEEEEDVLFRLRSIVSEAVPALQAARAAGVSVLEIAAILDYADSKPGAYGPGAVYNRIRTAVPGLAADRGWDKPAKAYLEKQARVAGEERRGAERAEFVHAKESARSEAAADPLAVFSADERLRVEAMSRDEIVALLVGSGNKLAAGVYRTIGLTHTVCWAISEAMKKSAAPERSTQ